jgi:hypothetical protein
MIDERVLSVLHLHDTNMGLDLEAEENVEKKSAGTDLSYNHVSTVMLLLNEQVRAPATIWNRPFQTFHVLATLPERSMALCFPSYHQGNGSNTLQHGDLVTPKQGRRNLFGLSASARTFGTARLFFENRRQLYTVASALCYHSLSLLDKSPTF